MNCRQELLDRIKDLTDEFRGLRTQVAYIRDKIFDEPRTPEQKPVSLRLTTKQIQQIINRFNDPLVLPREITRHIAENIAGHGNAFYQWQMSWHPLGFTAEAEFRPDGTLKMSFSDCNGQRFWSGVWHGVDG